MNSVALGLAEVQRLADGHAARNKCTLRVHVAVEDRGARRVADAGTPVG